MNLSKSLKIAKRFLGKEVEVVIDRLLGSEHPKHGFLYEVNYGFVPNTKAPDGEEISKTTNFQDQWFEHVILRE